MHTADEETIKLINWLKRIEDHIRGVTEMVEDQVYPIEIIKQIEDIQAALETINILMLDRHLHSCFIAAVRDHRPVEREIMLDQIAELFVVKSKYYH